MVIIDTSTRKRYRIDIIPVESGDYKSIAKRRYFFDWQEERKEEVYKLCKAGTNDILGLVSCERIPEEWRIHIRLLTVSKENRGSDKKYENIAGNLIAFICKLALMEYGELACVSLKPKGIIINHYIHKYGMNATGMVLSAEITEMLNLIKTYDND